MSTLVCIWLASHVLDRRHFASLGFHISRDWLIDFGFGLLLGGFLITSVFLIEVAAGWVTVTGTCVTRDSDDVFAIAILSGAVTMMLIGTQEELLSRGHQLTNLAEGLNCRCIDPRWSVIIASLLSAVLFALLHADNPHASAISTFSVFMGGIITALGYILTGELAIAIGLLITWNYFQSNVFGFPVSGMDFSSATFIATEQNGPKLWIGDAFGPEAGLLAICAVVLGCLLVLLWVRLRYGHIGVHMTIGEVVLRGEVVEEADMWDTCAKLRLAVDQVRIEEEAHPA